MVLAIAGWMNRQQQEVIAYLKEENRVLREQLGPKRVIVTESQKRRLARAAYALGRNVLFQIGTLFSPDTLLKWYRLLIARKYDGTGSRSKPGPEPAKAKMVRDLVLRMAQENPDWGYGRIHGELKALGYDVSWQTVRRIMLDLGLLPDPDRPYTTTWNQFLKSHFQSIAACDFFTVETLGLKGLTRWLVFFVIDLATRRVEIAGSRRPGKGRWSVGSGWAGSTQELPPAGRLRARTQPVTPQESPANAGNPVQAEMGRGEAGGRGRTSMGVVTRLGYAAAIALVLLTAGSLAWAAEPEPAGGPVAPATQPASASLLRVVEYKNAEGFPLRMHIVGPKEGAGRTAIVLFFCGAWAGFDAEKFFPQSAYFASRGALCFNAEVRVIGMPKGGTPVQCVIDARSAIRWVRAHAAEYGVDPNRIVAFGASAGGHVSACAAFANEFNDPNDDTKVSPRPDALLLACPAVAIHESERFNKTFGPDLAKALSPTLLVRAGGPPTLVMQGDADTTTPPSGAQAFQKAMQDAGNRCTVKMYPKEGHGFQNYHNGRNPSFKATVRDMDEFLASLNMLRGKPTVDSFVYVPFKTIPHPRVGRPPATAPDRAATPD